MPNNPKIFIKKTTVEITFRTEEGLPLVATPYIEAILKSVLSRAQSLYPVTICHLLVMSNHIHLIIVIEHPELVPRFFGYLKAELAHAINQMLGRKKRTVWCDGYDSPVILDYEKVIDRIVYIYTNPQKANLVDKIEDYPQYSTWKAFLDGGEELQLNRIPRDVIPRLPGGSLGFSMQQVLARALISEGLEETSLFIDPDAWMECFDDSSDADPNLLKEEIVRRVREKEEYFRAQRKNPVIGPHALRLELIRKPYVPRKRGKRMICLSSFKKLRVVFIYWFKEQCAEASRRYSMWRAGDRRAMPPPGMFSPGAVLFSNLNPIFVPV
jgi:REP element-mobilizing transposase RayT